MLTKRPHAPKGQSPFAGPFQIVKVLGRYSYQLSDGQKWNIRLLKRYLVPTADWTKFAPILQMPEMVEPFDNRGTDHSEAEDIAGRRYPDRERLPPDRYSPEDWRTGPSKKGRRN